MQVAYNMSCEVLICQTIWSRKIRFEIGDTPVSVSDTDAQLRQLQSADIEGEL